VRSQREEFAIAAARTRIVLIILMALPPAALASGAARAEDGSARQEKMSVGSKGTLRSHEDLSSQWVDERRIEVWLPPGYDQDQNRRYPVIYMHDGQGVFGTQIFPAEVDWGLVETVTRLIEEDRIRAAIVVGIWNTPKRMQEYLPAKPFQGTGQQAAETPFIQEHGPPLGDRYLSFLVTELKPFIDDGYRTLPGRDDTYTMGASMGGLISFSALCQYPEFFGAAACLSTHWPAVNGYLQPYLQDAIPDPSSHRVYFDYGTETLDAQYEPFQLLVDRWMRAAGYQSGRNWVTRKFPGEEHARTAWRKRLHIPVTFLLGHTPEARETWPGPGEGR
jgi:predicted alpha/beta superfamily hydrolase